MGAATGTLKVTTPKGTDTFSWNGIPKERAAARATFERLMASGNYLASVVDAPGRQTQIRTFDEAEQVEKQKGVVEVRMTPAIVGG